MGMKAPADAWKVTARGEGIDWSEIRDRVDLTDDNDRLTWPGPWPSWGAWPSAVVDLPVPPRPQSVVLRDARQTRMAMLRLF